MFRVFVQPLLWFLLHVLSLYSVQFLVGFACVFVELTFNCLGDFDDSDLGLEALSERQQFLYGFMIILGCRNRSLLA